MKKMKLGNDYIPGIAIGTWSWGTGFNGGDKVFGNTYQYDELYPVFKYAVENHLVLWDTAAIYGMGASESILGECIKSSSNIIISTKFSPLGLQGKKAMEHSFNKSVLRLNQPILDIYWIHNPSNVRKWTNQAILLHKAGKIKHIGVSNHNLQQVKEASLILEKNGLHLDAVQNHYSLLYRTSENTGLLDWCNKNETRFFAYMVLEQGALSNKYNSSNPFPSGSRRSKNFSPTKLAKIEPLIKYMTTIGEKYKADASQVAIAWALSKGTIPLVGATTTSQIDSLLHAEKIILSQEEIALLEETAYNTSVTTKTSWEK